MLLHVSQTFMLAGYEGHIQTRSWKLTSSVTSIYEATNSENFFLSITIYTLQGEHNWVSEKEALFFSLFLI